ncbi:MAG: LysR family transcriptional regulator [Rickettsiales bacterium]|nr:LysR family transcriptional regulator [Rickettsiales bacterium]
MSSKDFVYKNNPLQQIKGFCYTVQENSMTKAAHKIGITQSAVSHQIKSLERDLGIELFIREKNKIFLTEEGIIFYKHAISCLSGIESLFVDIKKNLRNQQNQISIASNHAVISYVLPKYLKKFREDEKLIKFKIRNLSKQDCFNKILNNEVDIVIYPTTQDEIPDELEFYSMVKYQPILLTHKQHALANKKEITLKDVSKYNLLRIDPNLITLPGFEELLKSHKISSSIEFEMSDWEILKKFVKADLGVAMISNIVLEGEEEKDLSQMHITQYFPEMDYGFFIKKGKKLEGVLENFVRLLQSYKPLEVQ